MLLTPLLFILFSGLSMGMRIIQGLDEFVEALLGAQREAAASFGISTILLEKYITQPRHIEVQVPFFIVSNCDRTHEFYSYFCFLIVFGC